MPRRAAIAAAITLISTLIFAALMLRFLP